MAEDRELEVMGTVLQALGDLEDEAVERVLRYAAERKGVVLAPGRGRQRYSEGAGEIGEFGDFASLYNAAGPSTDNDRALVGAYWFQEVNGQQDFDAQQVNAELKNLGHGVSNITKAFSRLMKKTKDRPNLVMQIQKSGKTKQARKKYRLTIQGVDAVKRMLRGGGEAEE
jgi:hypothetical protein